MVFWLVFSGREALPTRAHPDTAPATHRAAPDGSAGDRGMWAQRMLKLIDLAWVFAMRSSMQAKRPIPLSLYPPK